MQYVFAAQRAINMSAQGNALGLKATMMIEPCRGDTNGIYDLVHPCFMNLCRPVGAWNFVVDRFLGRCPRLICGCPVGAESQFLFLARN